jgi:hypothetical protein
VNEWLEGLRKDYITPMVQVVRDRHILNEILSRTNVQFSNLREAYFEALAPLKETFQTQLRESPFSTPQVEIISTLMGITPDDVVEQGAIFGLKSQIHGETQDLTEGQSSPSHSDFSTGNSPVQQDQKDYETPGKQKPSLGSKEPGFKIPKLTEASKATTVALQAQTPVNSKLQEKDPSAAQGYFTGQSAQVDRSLKRSRDPATEWESQPSSSQGNTGRKGGKGKGKGTGGKGKGQGGKGSGERGAVTDNKEIPKTWSKKQNRMTNFNLLTKEEKLDTPCPEGPKCQTVFKCGFQHNMMECAAANERVKAEAKVAQDLAVQNVINSHGLAEVSPGLSHILANQPPFPEWKYPAPRGFSNRRLTDEEVWRA